MRTFLILLVMLFHSLHGIAPAGVKDVQVTEADLPRLVHMANEVWDVLTTAARERGDAVNFPQLRILARPDRWIARFGRTANVVEIGQDFILATANLVRINICVFACPSIIANESIRGKLGDFIVYAEKRSVCSHNSIPNHLQDWPDVLGLNDDDFRALKNYRHAEGYNFEELSDNHFQRLLGFILAHELGHYVLHHDTIGSAAQIADNEVAADAYSKQLIESLVNFDVTGDATLVLLPKLAQITYNRGIPSEIVDTLGRRLIRHVRGMVLSSATPDEKAVAILEDIERRFLQMDIALERRRMCE